MYSSMYSYDDNLRDELTRELRAKHRVFKDPIEQKAYDFLIMMDVFIPYLKRINEK